MFLLMTLLSFWAEDPIHVVNEANCKFGHMVALPDDYRRNRLLKTCYANIKDEPKLTDGGTLQERTVRPLKELTSIPAE